MKLTTKNKMGQDLKFTVHFNEDEPAVHKALNEWKKRLEKQNLTPDRKERSHIRLFYQNLGFTKVRVNKDRTVNATINGKRFLRIYLKSIESE
jgi:hypothetical protein